MLAASINELKDAVEAAAAKINKGCSSNRQNCSNNTNNSNNTCSSNCTSNCGGNNYSVDSSNNSSNWGAWNTSVRRST